MHLGRHDDAIREGKIAAELAPLSAVSDSALGRFLYYERRYEEAVVELKRAVELEPRNVGANYRLDDVYAELGRYDEALAAFEEIGELMPQGGDFQGGLARVYALMGRQGEARETLRGLKANDSVIAAVHAALGDKDEAFRILGKAVEERQLVVSLKEDPRFENLHADPRWPAMLRRRNFPPQ
jgi:tetratricopeptide (TPR) repeat protein